jgi:hypothetical protein
MSVGFRTRTRGTIRQIGLKFPVLEKKKLPPRISLKRPTLSNMESGIENVTYIPPNENQDGYIEFTWDGHKLQGAIRLVDKEDAIGQWSTSGRPIVFLDKKLGIGFIKYCAEHELIERFLQTHYNIPWDPFGHLLAEHFEMAEYLKSHPKSEWDQYSTQVRQLSRMNAGGKTGHDKANLEKAFELLHHKQKILKWQSRGLDSIGQTRADKIEYAMFAKKLKEVIDKKLVES